MKKTFKTIGILGGMGPGATVDLYNWIVKLTLVKTDQEHIPTLIYSYPITPDRTAALISGGENPLPYLKFAGQTLEKAGASFIIIPCNTAHAFIPKLQKHLKIPIINMIEETGKYIRTNFPQTKKLGLLATTATIKTKLYQSILEKNGFEVITPNEEQQKDYVMEGIYGKNGVKAGVLKGIPTILFKKASDSLIKQGANAIIMGCTEIPIAMEGEKLSVPLINPTEVLAKAAIILTGKIPK